MSGKDEPSQSRRVDSTTAPSLLGDEELSLSALSRVAADGSLSWASAPAPSASAHAPSASRERDAEHWASLGAGSAGRFEVASAGEDAEGDVTLPSARASSSLAPGTVLAQRYVIRRLLGRGGMGQVYEAYDRVLSEPVALKTTTNESRSGAARLLEELRMGRRVTHPNVCRLYDAGVHEEPRGGGRTTHFLSMEYLEGHTLRRRLRHGLPALPQVFGIARQLLIGLDAMHSAGILHRDIKSENVMLRLPGNGTGQAVIMDFGLAQPLTEAALLGRADGVGAGSRGYMAPEQMRNLPLGPEADLFAFGVVMFEMLTGRLPFDRGPASAALHPPEASSAPPSQLRPAGGPPELDAFVLACLEPQPNQRYRSARRALAVLARIFETSMSRARAAGTSWASGHDFPRRGDRFRRSTPARIARL